MTFAERALSALGLLYEEAPPATTAAVSPEGAPARMKGLVNVWHRQLDAAMAHGVESVDALTQTFAGIERQLAQALELTEQAAQQMNGSDGMSGAVAQAQDRLNHVMAMIQDAVEANHAMFATVSEAVNAVRELNDTARSVEKISQMTTLLSINARIEAARAGEAGQGFSVVADEVRRLAAQSRQESMHILQRVARIEAVIQQAASSADTQRERDAQLLASSRTEVGEILAELGGSMQHMMAASDGLCAIGQETRSSVAMALVRFQYQDRVSQRLGHVRDSLQNVEDTLDAGWPDAPTLEALDARLLASYTMPEEGRTHRNEPEPDQGDGGLMLF